MTTRTGIEVAEEITPQWKVGPQRGPACMTHLLTPAALRWTSSSCGQAGSRSGTLRVDCVPQRSRDSLPHRNIQFAATHQSLHCTRKPKLSEYFVVPACDPKVQTTDLLCGNPRFDR